MSGQLAWNFGPRARRHDRPTAHAAAATIQPGPTEQAILRQFRYGFEITDDELAGMLPDLYAPTVKTARSRLAKAGLLVDTGRRRPSQRGCDQIVWRLA